MHILLTRPLEDCGNLLIKFKDLGHVVSHLPVIKIKKLEYKEPNFNDYSAIIVFDTTEFPYRVVAKYRNCL